MTPAAKKVAVAGCLALVALATLGAGMPTPGTVPAADVAYIDTSFENASPLWYNVTPEGIVEINLLYDHERDSPNRAAGHFHFRIHARRGARLTLEFKNLDNIYNGSPASIAPELRTAVISHDGKTWTPVKLTSLKTNRVQLSLEMTNSSIFVARAEPYRLSDLDGFLGRIRGRPLVSVEMIGHTVEGRPLEIIRVGSHSAPKRVFMRARSHPWEPGGNWVIEGLVDRLLQSDAEAARLLERYCLYLLPMANKDGVAHGRTRFNLRGKDLNRGWDVAADPELAPENHALEKWLDRMIKAGQQPNLAIEWHNDGWGRLHIGRPPVPGVEAYVARMRRFEGLLREHTWFREGVQMGSARNSGTLGDGWFARFGVDAVVHELNCNWIEGANDFPTAQRWREYGASLAGVLEEYLGK